MADDDINEPITIIIPAEGEDAAPAKPGEAHQAPPGDNADEGFEALKRQIAAKDEELKRANDTNDAAIRQADANRERALRAERQRDEASRQAGVNANATQQAEYDSVVNSLSAHQTELQSLEQALQAALTEQDFAKVAKLQGQIGTATARIVQAQDAKAAIEARAKQTPRQPQQQERQVDWNQIWNQPWDQQTFEKYLTEQASNRTAAWMRANPRFATDPGFRRQLSGAHNVLTGKGIGVDTPEYFRGIEEMVGLRTAPEETPAQQKPPGGDPVSQTAKPVQERQSQQRPPPAPAAAPSRQVQTSPNQPGAHGTPITLTAEERAFARATMTPDIIGKDRNPEVVFAQQKAEMIRTGKWDSWKR